MVNSVDYLSFEEVMKELEMSQEELQAMVDNGGLRAFRDERHLKFIKDDVEIAKTTRKTSPESAESKPKPMC